jgi:hypothetical protein
MAIDTVTLTADAVWQDGTPFAGYLEVTLQKPGAAADALVAPKKAQEIAFTEGTAAVTLVPSSDLDGAKYRIRVVTTSIEGNYKSKTAIIDELVEIPDTDCTLHGLLAASQEPAAEPEPAA